MKPTFNDLGVSENILKALETLGFDNPTIVQEQSIGPILGKKDLIVKSKTGSGKTAAFGIPIIQQVEKESVKPQALILTPTRELAVQVEGDLKAIGKHTGLHFTSLYGQHNINVEIKALENGVQIVAGTPGRVMDHIRKGTLKTDELKFFVLDEADRMLDMGFIDQVVSIIKRLPKERVTLLFSATMPYEIQNICQKYMKDPETIEIESETETVDSITQFYHKVQKDEKRTQLNRVILVENPESCIIFCNTRFQVDKVNEFLRRKGYAAQALHGAISQSRRLKTINQFKNGEFTFLVATDVASRGIHVDDISHVINYDIPLDKDSYTHRIGRTGRAGNGGRAISLATSDDIMSLYEIEEHIGAMIDERDVPTEEEVASKKVATEKALKRYTKQRIHSKEKSQHSGHHRKKLTSKEAKHKKVQKELSKTYKKHPTSKDEMPKTKKYNDRTQHKKRVQGQPVKEPHMKSAETFVSNKKMAPPKKTYNRKPQEVKTIVLNGVSNHDDRKWVPKKESGLKKFIKKIFKK